jgi:hypothetical protein
MEVICIVMLSSAAVHESMILRSSRALLKLASYLCQYVQYVHDGSSANEVKCTWWSEDFLVLRARDGSDGDAGLYLSIYFLCVGNNMRWATMFWYKKC